MRGILKGRRLGRRSRVLDALRQLLDLALGCVELLAAEPVELFAPLPERECVVERHVAALQPLDDPGQLLLCLFEPHGFTSLTVPEKPPAASRTSISSPEL